MPALVPHTRLCAAALITLATLGIATTAGAQSITRDRFDISGIRLGMTEAQAKAAMQAAEPQGSIAAHRAAFSYTDKVANFSTPEFLDTLVLTTRSTGNTIRVWFSGPVGEVRVIGVARSQFGINPPSTLAQYRQSLRTKYGEPTGANDQSATQPVWEESGKRSCIRVNQRGGQPSVAIGQFMTITQTGNGPQDMENRYERDRMQIRKDLLPADLTQCGAFVFWSLVGDPVSGLYAGMYDVGALLATERTRNQWVDRLEAEAVRKREAASPAPRL